MPRRRQNQRRKSGRRRSGGDIITTTVRSLGTLTLTAGVGVQTMGPGGFSTSASLADVYELYRVVSLRYRLIPATTITATQAVGYIPGVVDNASSVTTLVISQLDNHAILGVRQVVPSSWVKVSRTKLSSYMTWYKTITGTPDPAEEVQGNLYLAGTGTETVTYEVQAVYQFKNLVNNGATPQMRAESAMYAEKERLLKILSSQKPTASGIRHVALPPAPACPPGS